MPSGACVQCDENNVQVAPGQPEDECPSSLMPVCDGDTHTCRACEAHSECFSKVCDAGLCVPPAQVIYLSANGTDSGGNNCDNPASGQGCLTMQFAIGRLTATRKYIFMEPSATPYAARLTSGSADFNGVSAMIVGKGASLRRTGVGPVIEVHSGASVAIDGLSVEYGEGDGISCTGSMISVANATLHSNDGVGLAASSCTSRVVRSTFVTNDAGGVIINSGSYYLVNNFIVGNGTLTTSTFGGVMIDSAATSNVFEFNSVALNLSPVSYVDSVSCMNSGLVARNNLIVGSATRQHVNVGTSCTFRYTLFTPDNGIAGEGNMTIADQAMYNFAGGSDLHIGAGSVAAGKAQSTNLAGETLFDADGNARVLNGTTVDVGADEIP